LAIKRKEVLIPTATWMKLEKTLNERSQIQRLHTMRFHLYESRIGQGVGEEKIGSDN
jgi:hypothetical protein